MITIIKQHRTRLVGHAALIQEITKFWFKSLKGRHHSEDTGIDGRIILKWILGKQI
jgi:hypothetical protein